MVGGEEREIEVPAAAAATRKLLSPERRREETERFESLSIVAAWDPIVSVLVATEQRRNDWRRKEGFSRVFELKAKFLDVNCNYGLGIITIEPGTIVNRDGVFYFYKPKWPNNMLSTSSVASPDGASSMYLTLPMLLFSLSITNHRASSWQSVYFFVFFLWFSSISVHTIWFFFFGLLWSNNFVNSSLEHREQALGKLS